MESGHASLAVEVPNRVSQGVGVRVATRGVGDGATTGAGGGAAAAIGGDASVGVDEEFDWLNKGLEGENFADDI